MRRFLVRGNSDGSLPHELGDRLDSLDDHHGRRLASVRRLGRGGSPTPKAARAERRRRSCHWKNVFPPSAASRGSRHPALGFHQLLPRLACHGTAALCDQSDRDDDLGTGIRRGGKELPGHGFLDGSTKLRGVEGELRPSLFIAVTGKRHVLFDIFGRCRQQALRHFLRHPHLACGTALISACGPSGHPVHGPSPAANPCNRKRPALPTRTRRIDAIHAERPIALLRRRAHRHTGASGSRCWRRMA